MSDHIPMIASILAGLVAGRLCAGPAIGRLRRRLADATWALRRDALTGLLNRTGLVEVHAVRRPNQQDDLLVLVDLDEFKTVNDTHGHDVGDQVLVAAADRIDAVASLHGGIAARLAGDEFVVVLPIRREDFDRPVELILAMISASAVVHADATPVVLTVTASAGVCRVESADDLDAVLRRADVAMYHAKRAGGGCHINYQPGMVMPHPTARKGPRQRDRRERGEAR